MSLIRLPFLIYLMFLVSACSKGPAPTKISITKSFAMAAGSGGLMLYIRNKTTKVSQAKAIVSSTHAIPLEDGTYEFRVVGWDGDVPFKGNIFCGETTADIQAKMDPAVEVLVHANNCKSKVFNPAAFLDSNQLPKQLQLVTCHTLVGLNSSKCDDIARGGSVSFLFKLIAYKDLPKVALSPNNESLSSECTLAPASPLSLLSLGTRVPYGSLEEDFATVIESYTDTECSKGKKVYFFPKGLAHPPIDPNLALMFSAPNYMKYFLKHEGLLINGSDFGSVPINGSNLITLTVSNFSNERYTDLNATIPVGYFNFAAPYSYPGGTGTCSDTLEVGETCTITVSFIPVTTGPHSNNLTLSYTANGEAGTINFVLKGQAVAAPQLVATTPNHNFGFRSQTLGALVHNFIITNSGGVAAMNVSVLPLTPPLSYTHNCPSSLGPNESCDITVTLDPTTGGGTFTQNLQVSHVLGAVTNTLTMPLTGGVTRTGVLAPFYTNAADWNDYLIDGPSPGFFSESNNPCSLGLTRCHHGGVLKKAEMPVEYNSLSCTDLIPSDSLNAFEWECDDAVTPRIIRSRGLKKDKGLRDLVSATGLRPNYLSVKDAANNVIFKTTNDNWWPNNPIHVFTNTSPINNVTTATNAASITFAGGDARNSSDGVSGTLVTINFNIAKAIYIISSDIHLPGINLSMDKISLVTLPGVKIIGNNSSNVNNCALTGAINPASTPALICTGKQFSWIEVDASMPDHSHTNTLLNLGTMAAFTNVKNSQFKNGNIAIKSSSTYPNFIRDSLTLNSKDSGIYLDQTQTHSLINNKLVNAGMTSNAALRIDGASNNIIHGLRISGAGNGSIRISTSQNNIITNTLNSSGSGHPLLIDAASEKNTIANSSFLNNTEGVKLASSNLNTISNSIVANSSLGGSGFDITGDYNQLINVAASNNYTNVSVISGLYNMFSNFYEGPATSVNCMNGGGATNTIDGASIANGVCPNVHTIDLSNTFVGRVTNDTINTHSLISGVLAFTNITDHQFQNIFRSWGTSGTTPMISASAGACSGNCSVWDWRINESDNAIRKVAGECPVDGDNNITDKMLTPNTYLTHASEVMMDGVGDDDGLCESNESCIYAPNIGAYQGEGSLVSCGYIQDSGPSGITLQAFKNAGAP